MPPEGAPKWPPPTDRHRDQCNPPRLRPIPQDPHPRHGGTCPNSPRRDRNRMGRRSRCGAGRSRDHEEQGRKDLSFEHRSPKTSDEICLDNCRERRLEDSCFGKQGIVFMRISPLREDIVVLAQCVSYARIYRPIRHGACYFGHPVLKQFPRVLSQAIEQHQKIVSFDGRPFAFAAVPCLQTDLDGEGQENRDRYRGSFTPCTVPPFSIEMFHKPPEFLCPRHHQIWIVLPEAVP